MLALALVPRIATCSMSPSFTCLLIWVRLRPLLLEPRGANERPDHCLIIRALDHAIAHLRALHTVRPRAPTLPVCPRAPTRCLLLLHYACECLRDASAYALTLCAFCTRCARRTPCALHVHTRFAHLCYTRDDSCTLDCFVLSGHVSCPYVRVACSLSRLG